MSETNEEFIVSNYKSYTQEYSKFPYEVITQHYFKDADDSIASLINEINSLKERGLYQLAQQKCVEYSDILADYTFGAEVINRIIEDIRNAQIMAIQKHQFLYIQNDIPEYLAKGDVWIVLPE